MGIALGAWLRGPGAGWCSGSGVWAQRAGLEAHEDSARRCEPALFPSDLVLQVLVAGFVGSGVVPEPLALGVQ